MCLVFPSLYAQESEETFKPSMKMGGRVMYDFNFLSAGDNYQVNGNEFRRVRLSVKGKATKNINYKVEVDLAGSDVNLRDVYLQFLFPENAGNLKLGSFTEPSSLDNMTSSNSMTFFERSMMSNTQPYIYNAGFMYANHKLLDGKIGVQLAYTFNGYNNYKSAFTDTNIEGGANFIGRLTGIVLNNKEKKQVVHLGVNYERRDDNEDEYDYSFRVENHMGDKFKVIASPDNEDAIALGNFKNTSDIGFELATASGPLSLQAEYEMSSIVTDIDTYKIAGYYAFASFFVTGEHRSYKNGAFGGIKPKSEFCLKDGKFGALELVARYSVMDFSSYPGVADNNSIANITAGFNWYLNKNTRIMYNYTNANFNDLMIYGDDNLMGHLLRFQVNF